MHAVWLWEHDDIGVEIPLLGHVFLQCLLHALELIIFVYSIRGEQTIGRELCRRLDHDWVAIVGRHRIQIKSASCVGFYLEISDFMKGAHANSSPHSLVVMQHLLIHFVPSLRKHYTGAGL
ncbi:uncharacterized protein AFUA_3G02860 [Aspergillus fumigatus Af293]|uniref:Uncharacterized protein n=2 Tax=Aspergillus fumigatus TaxID=746128 RepID=Q4WFA7_ASPFU|nr:hypothetical protein AFUA_3G02860 [Aspergillus fumigatus Af293]EAL86570.1 hypothetical protein AFUA_3G02860 [Aspergillus fumigatus Af293]EDP53364.1 hypothetical protein AFUB_045390 [Aspergillus fumigatus A1163]